jgi:Kdo2-lipid IVA lauroyltransferase/acyltransferase
MEIGARLVVLLLRLLQHLPLPVLARLGRGLGAVLYRLGRERRAIAERNIELCFPQLEARARDALVREHFALLGRSLLERGLLWYAPVERLKRLIHVEGDVGLAERSERPVMWIVPHFLGLEVAAAAGQLFQSRTGVNIYQAQSSSYFDKVLKEGRLRFGRAEAHQRGVSIRHVIKRIKEGAPFFNMPDQDFGRKDSAFVPFFGVPAATLLAPSRMARALDMIVQPVVVDVLPGGQGYRVHFMPPFEDWPTDDPLTDTARMNAFIETQILRDPPQYLWVHKRFKTRPVGEPTLYEGARARASGAG